MPIDVPRPSALHRRVPRREFLQRLTWGGAAATAFMVGARPGLAIAQTTPNYPDWVPPSPKPPKRGGSMTRASAWDPPVLDPRLTNSVGLFQFASLVGNRIVRYPFSDEASGPGDLSLKGDLAESWTASPDSRVWTFKLRQGVKWHNVAPVNGREFVAADVKYCFEQYAKEGVQSFTFQEIEATETPDKYTVRVHLKTPNVFFAHDLAEPVTVMFPREVLEEDGDLKKRMIGTGPYMMKEHTRKVRVVLARHPDYFDKGRPYFDEYTILSAPDDATRKAAFRTGQSDLMWVASPSEADTIKKTNANAVVETYHNMQTPFGLALAQDKPPYAAQLGPYWQYKPAEAKKLMTEAGHGNGFETTLFYYEYFPQMTSQVQLVQQDLKKNLNINLKINKLDYTTFYGRYAEGKWDGMAWGFKTGYAIGLDEQGYQYMHSKSTKNYFRMSDPVIDDLLTKLRQTSNAAEQRTLARKVFDRELDQVTRMWMPYDGGFLIWQPHMRNVGALAMRRSDGYGASTLARVWAEK